MHDVEVDNSVLASSLSELSVMLNLFREHHAMPGFFLTNDTPLLISIGKEKIRLTLTAERRTISIFLTAKVTDDSKEIAVSFLVLKDILNRSGLRNNCYSKVYLSIEADQLVVSFSESGDYLSLSRLDDARFLVLKPEDNNLFELSEANIIIRSECFLRNLQETFYAASTDEAHTILNCTLMSIKEGQLTSVCTDGRRLAISKSVTNFSISNEIALLISSLTIQVLIGLLSSKKEKKLYEESCLQSLPLIHDAENGQFNAQKYTNFENENPGMIYIKITNDQGFEDKMRVHFAFDNFLLTDTLESYTYPNYDQAFPPGCAKILVNVSRLELIQALHFNIAIDKDVVEISIEGCDMHLSTACKDPSKNSGLTEVSISHEDVCAQANICKNVKFNINPIYLMDACENMSSEQLFLSYYGEGEPIKIEDRKYNSVVLIMPINL